MTVMSNPSKTIRIKDFPKSFIYGLVMVCGFAGFMIWDQLYWWNTRDDYSFGFLVPLFSIYIIYERRDAIAEFLSGKSAHTTKDSVQVIPSSNSNSSPSLGSVLNVSALIVFMLGGLLFFLGALIRTATMPQNPSTLAISAGFSMILLSAVFIFSKERLDGENAPIKDRFKFTFLFLFPALIWLISAPLISVVETQVKVYLLTQVTIIVFNILEVFGYAIERQGNILILPNGSVGVEEACSGIRSLTACLFVGSFLGAVYLNKFWKKVLLVIMAMFFAFLTNLFRSGFLTLWAYYHGSTAINDHWVLPIIGDIGSVHDVMGFAVLGLTCVGLICLLPIMNFSLEAYLNKGTEVSDTEDSES